MKATSKNVVRLYTRKFLGEYSYAQERERIPEAVLFYAGVILTVALPQIICTAYGGIIPFIAFAGTASAGSLIGWAMYRQAPHRVASCVGTRSARRAPLSGTAADEMAEFDKAA
jgi:hypothetical protein